MLLARKCYNNRPQTHGRTCTMPIVHHVKKARKAYRRHGIKKGDEYFWWRTRAKGQLNGVKHYSKTRPRPSQLTMSPFRSEFLSLSEELDDLPRDGEAEDLAESIRDIASRFRDLSEETRGAQGNLPESLQSSPTGELLISRADACEDCATHLEEIADRLEGEGGSDGVESILADISLEEPE